MLASAKEVLNDLITNISLSNFNHCSATSFKSKEDMRIFIKYAKFSVDKVFGELMGV
jgi:hypothetical protein